jgi:hypothetical protein
VTMFEGKRVEMAGESYEALYDALQLAKEILDFGSLPQASISIGEAMVEYKKSLAKIEARLKEYTIIVSTPEPKTACVEEDIKASEIFVTVGLGTIRKLLAGEEVINNGVVLMPHSNIINAAGEEPKTANICHDCPRAGVCQYCNKERHQCAHGTRPSLCYDCETNKSCSHEVPCLTMADRTIRSCIYQ